MFTSSTNINDVSIEDTTVIEKHENLIPYLMLVFSPKFKLFYDKTDGKVDGILSGVGYDTPTDLKIRLFKKIEKKQLVNCEGIRFFIKSILSASDNKVGERMISSDPQAIQEMQNKLIDLTLNLLNFKESASKVSNNK